jgi:hypothetical protein
MNTSAATPAPHPIPSASVTPDSIGVHASDITVELSTRFLEHFSEFMYSSPQKAFEELVSNGWDALAEYVDIWIPTNLTGKGATLAVLDNGESMDEAGLRQLWHIAFSTKRKQPARGGRKIVGQFGIGKLATYVLARKLTYICKAADGKIRRVTMDYGLVDQQKEDGEDRLIRDLSLPLYDVDEAEVAAALVGVHGGEQILRQIRNDVPHPGPGGEVDEYGAAPEALEPPPRGTWTLVILSELKPTGRELKLGILRRMLQSALPFRSSMAICVNGEQLTSSKISAEMTRRWTIGPALGITGFEFEERNADDVPVSETIPVTVGQDPVPHIMLPGIGMVTGTITLFENQISGGKSEDLGASNGFHVNVLGRLVNQSDAMFGETNLNHAAWARFRMTVRADGLNELLTTDREKFKDRRELRLFRAFLRRCFNLARGEYDSDSAVSMPDGGDVLVQSLGVVSLSPLRNVVSDVLASETAPPDIFDDAGLGDRKDHNKRWKERTSENIRNALSEVKFEAGGDSSLVKFRLADNAIVVNKDHPFAIEHSHSRAERELLRTMAMVNLLSDVYAINLGIPPESLREVREYREQLLRFRAMQGRRSGLHIAKLLLQTQHDSANSQLLEKVVSDALRYIGFQVRDLATSGEPEGIASAFPTPSGVAPTVENPQPPLYSFTFDAKSSKHEVAATGNIKLDGIVEHRRRHGADYALVVAPGFSDGALATRCAQQGVTPMTAFDLGRLLEYTVEHGAIPLTRLRELFSFFDPAAVSKWVDDLGIWMRTQRPLSLDIFLRALKGLEGQVPDVLAAGMVSLYCRSTLKVPTVLDEHVIALARGLAILVPDLVGVDGEKLIINATADGVKAAVAAQIESLHSVHPHNDDQT